MGRALRPPTTAAVGSMWFFRHVHERDTMEQTLERDEAAAAEPVATSEPVDDTVLVEEELLVEEISIDGMCGVY